MKKSREVFRSGFIDVKIKIRIRYDATFRQLVGIIGLECAVRSPTRPFMPPVELWSQRIDKIGFSDRSFQGRSAMFHDFDLEVVDRKTLTRMVIDRMIGNGAIFSFRV